MIVLISNRYPFKDGEPFLHNEIRELSKYDEKIVIYPLQHTKNESLDCYELPKNVEVRTLSKVNKATEFKCSTKALLSSVFKEEGKNLTKDKYFLKNILKAFYYNKEIGKYTDLIAEDINTNFKEELKGDSLLFYAYWMHLPACIGAQLKEKYKNSSFITRAHGYDLYKFRSSTGYLPNRNDIFKKADQIFTISEAGKKYLMNSYPALDSSKITCSYLGTYNYGLNPLEEDKIRLVSCSNIVPVKRLNLLIEALSMLKDFPIEWIHYGSGAEEKSIHTLAEEKIQLPIHYSFKGKMENRQLMEQYQQKHFTFFINVSESEGLPVSIMEAMSFGIPVIATDVGGTKEIVKDGYNGFLIPKDINSDDLAETIRKVLTLSLEENIRMRNNSRKTWEEKFDANKNYKDFYKAIKKLEDK